MALASSPGCNDVVNGESKCFKRWTENDNPKEALKCCMSYREGEISQFNVPIIVLPHRIHYEYRRNRENIPENPKCIPRSFNDIIGFFNFLDGYKKIPFMKFPDRTKSLNWNCFNTKDRYDGSQILKPRNTTRKNRLISSKPEQIQHIKNRFENNFCRSLLYEYHLSYSPKEFQETVCDRTGETIFPYQAARHVRLSHFNLQEQTPKHFFDEFRKPIFMRNKNGSIDGTKYVAEYEQKRTNNTITVFQDFREAWRGMDVQFQENHQYRRNHHHAKFNAGGIPVVQSDASVWEFHCGCFA